MDLKNSGYTSKINSLEVSSRNGFSDRVRDWLSDFQSRILPETPCSMVKNETVLHPQEIEFRKKQQQKSEIDSMTREDFDAPNVIMQTMGQVEALKQATIEGRESN